MTQALMQKRAEALAYILGRMMVSDNPAVRSAIVTQTAYAVDEGYGVPDWLFEWAEAAAAAGNAPLDGEYLRQHPIF